MSEIKGQLLGIILTISIFGIVIAAMAAAFTTASQSISKKITDAASTSVTPVEYESNDYTLLY